MKKVSIGLIGAGAMARQHLQVIKAIEGVEVVGLTSRTRARAELLAREFGINACYDTIQDLARQASVDALMVLVNADQMFSVGKEALTLGVPVFFEKPAGLTPEENLELADLAQNKNIPNMVGFNRRYYSIYRKGLDIIRQHGPLLGISIEGHERIWRIHEAATFNPKIVHSWLYANSTHTIDLLRFFGGEINGLNVFGRRLREPLGDQFTAIMTMDSGALAQYQAFWHSPGGWRAVLYGDGVTVEFKPLEKGQWTDKDLKTHDIEPDIEDVQFKPGLYGQMSAFIQLVKGNHTQWPAADLKSAYETMVLAQKFAQAVVPFKST
jgi:predicted dehydrogenase